MYSTQISPLAGAAPAPQTFTQPIDVGGAYITPPQGRIFFVCGDGTTVTNLDDAYSALSTNMERRRFASVALALAECKASRGDTIYVHPTHTENLASANSWPFVAGVRILGLGHGDTRPTFTFTTATSTLLVNKANVQIDNCRFLCAGPAGTTALTVAAPFTVSGEGFRFTRNFCEVGIDADQLCTDFFVTTAAADNLLIMDNEITAQAAAAAITSLFTFVGADFLKFIGNRCKAGFANAATALLNFATTASLNVTVAGNLLHQWTATSTGGLTCGAVASTGWVVDNEFATEDTAATGIVPIVLNAACLFRQNRNYVSNEKQTRGTLLGTEAA
jgi:hypothetical protein